MVVTMLSDVARPHNSHKIGKLEAVKINFRHLPFGLYVTPFTRKISYQLIAVPSPQTVVKLSLQEPFKLNNFLAKHGYSKYAEIPATENPPNS